MLRKVYTVLTKIPTYLWPSHHLHTLGNSNPALGHSRISFIDAIYMAHDRKRHHFCYANVYFLESWTQFPGGGITLKSHKHCREYSLITK